ncbi:MAG: D-aminoacylase [Nocardioidaceae bacterium]|nr:D-aminoacylase [Nocardioidaceae bacterium]
MLDLVIRGGTVYDGDSDPLQADVGVAGDRVVRVGRVDADAGTEIDATGKAVCPGFINVLSHSYFTVLHDPRSLSELAQGVTTQIFGEGSAMGPLTPAMRRQLEDANSELDIHVEWSRLSEYLRHLERGGCSQNFASFVSHGTVRPFVMGYDDRPATPTELDEMCNLVAEETADGALGLASALIYPPESYGSTEELIALCRAVATYDGKYISHIRNEGAQLQGAIAELVRICREGGLPAEIYHLKASGRANWHRMDGALEQVEAARREGLPVTADVYPYTASSTGLTSIVPDRFHEGGPEALYDRLADPRTREEIRRALLDEDGWGDTEHSDDILVLGLRREEHRRHQGSTLTVVADDRGVEPVDAALDLMRDDRSRVSVAFFSMSEDNLREQMRRPWVGFGSDGASMAPEGAFVRTPVHPRAYGTFARVLGRYVREQRVLSLREAVRRMTVLPATKLGLSGRGRLAEGYAADVVVFDPDTVADRATFEHPHQLAVGVSDVIVNGQVAVRNSRSTGRMAGRALYGAGRRR